jgi:hypothetical protein
MDFRQTMQPSGGRPAPTPAPAAPERREEKASNKKFNKEGSQWMKILSMVLLVAIAILLVGVIFTVTRGGDASEGKFVINSDYQAVFLNNGQVYFGNIDNLTSSYVRMSNIYYLTQGSGSSSSNYSLVKLGCQQIHDPLDQMVINRDQVTFWENLNSSGKVVTSIKQFQQQNPNGPNCSNVSTQTQASSGSSATQGATGSTPSDTGSSSTTK